jgi:gliding motility-associated-like protein
MGGSYQQDDISIVFDTEGMFVLSAIRYANGCASPQQETVITIATCPSELLYIPNAFTPDGNEHNNTLCFVVGDAFDPYNFSVTIYNRWGELVYESHNPVEEWDGTYNNQICQSGTYTYHIVLKNKETSKQYAYDGHVTLLK